MPKCHDMSATFPAKIQCVIVEECAGEIIVWLLRRITSDSGRRNDMRHRGTGASFSRAPSIAATPEVATPKSSAVVEVLAVIIGVKI